MLDGLPPTALPDEAAKHADAAPVGEVEGAREALLDDYENRILKKRYRREAPVDLADVNPYPRISSLPPNTAISGPCSCAAAACIDASSAAHKRTKPSDLCEVQKNRRSGSVHTPVIPGSYR